MHCKRIPLSFSALTFLITVLVACDGSNQPGGQAPAPKPAVVQGDTPTPPKQQSTSGGSGATSNGSIQAIPAKYQLGDIEPGSEHARGYVLRNMANRPIRVARAVTSCKCTSTTDITNQVIAPGASLEFEAVLLAPRTPGVKEAKVQIVFEGGLRPITLVLEGDVTMAIKATPAYVGGERGKESAGTMQLQSIDGRTFSIISAGGEAPRYVGFDPSTHPLQTTYRLAWDIGRIQDLPRHVWWVVFTDHPDCPVLPLRIRNDLTGSRADMERYARYWMFDENIVNAERLQSGRSVDLDVVIKHYNPQGRGAVERPDWLNVVSVRSLSPDASAALLSVEPLSQDELRVTFQFTPRAGFSGPVYALVAIETATGIGECAVLALVGERTP